MALHIMKTARAVLGASRGAGGTPTRLLYFDDGFDPAGRQDDPPAAAPQQLLRLLLRGGRHRDEHDLDERHPRYDDLAWLGNTHIKAVASSTGAGADKTWTFPPRARRTTSRARDPVRLQRRHRGGPAGGVARLLPRRRAHLKWDKTGDGLVTFDSKMVSPSVLTQISAFTGSLSNRTVTLASADVTKVYVDTTTIGSTEDNYWIDASWTLTNGFKNLYTLNGTTRRRTPSGRTRGRGSSTAPATTAARRRRRVGRLHRQDGPQGPHQDDRTRPRRVELLDQARPVRRLHRDAVGRGRRARRPEVHARAGLRRDRHDGLPADRRQRRRERSRKA
jgi:hypothetical protein